MITTGIVVAFYSGGNTLAASGASWFSRGMFILKRLDDLADVFSAGKLMLKGFNVAPNFKFNAVLDGSSLGIKWQRTGISGDVDWQTWQKKLQKQAVDDSEYDVYLPNGDDLPADSKLLSVVKDSDGNIITDKDGYGIGCVSRASWGISSTLLPRTDFLASNPTLYASASGLPPRQVIRALPPVAAAESGCPLGTAPAVIRASQDVLDLILQLKAKLSKTPFAWSNADIDVFIADFSDNKNLLERFFSDDLDPAVWKKFNELTGPTKAWVRKSVALQERIKAKIADGTFTNTDVDKLKSYYSSFQMPTSCVTRPRCTFQGDGFSVDFDDYGHPRFESFVPEMSGVGKIRYKPSEINNPDYPELRGGPSSSSNRARDLSDANAWADATYNTSGQTDKFIPLQNGNFKIIDSDGNETLCTWHHHEDGRTMIPVPSNIHQRPLGGASHSGGATVINPNNLRDFFPEHTW